MKRGDKAWSEAEFETMADMRSESASIDQIAEALGRSNASVRNKLANRTSVTRPPIVAAPSARHCANRAEFVTATLMGDPPAGRSALDQRGQP